MLANHLAELPSDYRKVLILRHCEGLPFKDIAKRMGRSTGAIRMLWLRAIGQIREQMSRGHLMKPCDTAKNLSIDSLSPKVQQRLDRGSRKLSIRPGERAFAKCGRPRETISRTGRTASRLFE